MGETIELRNRELHIDYKENVGVNVGVKEQKVNDLIMLDNRITAKLIAEKLGFSQRHIERAISELKKNGIIRRVGSDKSGFWEITK